MSLEAIFEAFPQSILQMIAMVYYGETNIISIISILVSMFSVCSKSFVFSVAAGKDFLSIFFMWICCVTDFVGIFFTVSWVFYNPNNDNNNNNNDFHFVAIVWFIKVCLCVVPGVVCATSYGVFALGVTFWVNLSLGHSGNNCVTFCELTITFTMCLLLWCFVLIFSLIMIEIFNFIFLGIIIFFFYMNKWPNKTIELKFWQDIFSWIFLNQGYDITSITSVTDITSIRNSDGIDISAQKNRSAEERLNIDEKDLKGTTIAKYGLKTGIRDESIVTPLVCSKKQDRIIRLSCINYVLSGDEFDTEMHYLLKAHWRTAFVDVKLRDLR